MKSFRFALLLVASFLLAIGAFASDGDTLEKFLHDAATELGEDFLLDSCETSATAIDHELAPYPPHGYEPPIAGFCYSDCSPCETRADCPFYETCTQERLC